MIQQGILRHSRQPPLPTKLTVQLAPLKLWTNWLPLALASCGEVDGLPNDIKIIDEATILIELNLSLGLLQTVVLQIEGMNF